MNFSPLRPAVILVLILGLLAVTGAPPALAQSLNTLRASGAVGEGFDGYARARKPGAGAQVEAINSKRRSIYAKRAGEQGTTADQVGRVYSRQILSGAPPGTWFLQESGDWTKK